MWTNLQYPEISGIIQRNHSEQDICPTYLKTTPTQGILNSNSKDSIIRKVNRAMMEIHQSELHLEQPGLKSLFIACIYRTSGRTPYAPAQALILVLKRKWVVSETTGIESNRKRLDVFFDFKRQFSISALTHKRENNANNDNNNDDNSNEEKERGKRERGK